MDENYYMHQFSLTRRELLEAALDYIRNQQADDAFEDFLRENRYRWVDA